MFSKIRAALGGRDEDFAERAVIVEPGSNRDRLIAADDREGLCGAGAGEGFA